MFDIGFWELSLIGIVALLVIGPERLPAVARTVGKYVGKANRFIASVKDDINKELKDEDLKRILEEQQKLADEYKQAASAMSSSIASETESLRETVAVDDLLEIQEPDEQNKTAQSASSTSKAESKKSVHPPPTNTIEPTETLQTASTSESSNSAEPISKP